MKRFLVLDATAAQTLVALLNAKGVEGVEVESLQAALVDADNELTSLREPAVIGYLQQSADLDGKPESAQFLWAKDVEDGAGFDPVIGLEAHRKCVHALKSDIEYLKGKLALQTDKPASPVAIYQISRDARFRLYRQLHTNKPRLNVAASDVRVLAQVPVMLYEPSSPPRHPVTAITQVEPAQCSRIRRQLEKMESTIEIYAADLRALMKVKTMPFLEKAPVEAVPVKDEGAKVLKLAADRLQAGQTRDDEPSESVWNRAVNACAESLRRTASRCVTPEYEAMIEQDANKPAAYLREGMGCWQVVDDKGIVQNECPSKPIAITWVMENGMRLELAEAPSDDPCDHIWVSDRPTSGQYCKVCGVDA